MVVDPQYLVDEQDLFDAIRGTATLVDQINGDSYRYFSALTDSLDEPPSRPTEISFFEVPMWRRKQKQPTSHSEDAVAVLSSQRYHSREGPQILSFGNIEWPAGYSSYSCQHNISLLDSLLELCRDSEVPAGSHSPRIQTPTASDGGK